MYVPGALGDAITELHGEYTKLFSDQYIYTGMMESTVRKWFQMMSIDFHKALNNRMAEMMEVVGVTNAQIEESRLIQHRMGHFSPKPVASLTNAKIKKRTDATIYNYAAQAEDDLIPKFKKAFPNQSTDAFTNEWPKLCRQAIGIISVVGGELAVLAGEVETGTRASVAAAKERAETDMQKAVELSAKMKWLH